MRPRSITGPLLLVAIGIVFLINNIWHDISFWSLVADYWPMLLILVGVIGLVEVFYHVGRGSTMPPRPIAGAGIFWVLVICTFTIWGGGRTPFHLGSINAGGVTILGTDYGYDVNASSGTAGVTRVVLDNISGNLSLKGQDGGQLTVSGRRTVRAFNHSDADRANSESTIRVERQGDLLVVRAEEPRSMRMLSVSTDLDITLPKGLNVEARGRSGDLSIDDMNGSVDVSNGHGDVRLNNIGKDVKIESSHSGMIHAADLKGNLDVQGHGSDLQIENVQGQVTINGEYSGTLEFRALARPLHFQSSRSDFRAEQIPGAVTIDLGEVKMNDVVGPVRLESDRRDVQATDVSNSLELAIQHGDLQVTETKTPLPKMEIRTRGGDITLTLPAKASFEIDGRTAQGEIDNQYGAPLTVDNDGRAGTIKGGTGSGPRLTLNTDRGKLSVR